jgi:ABC-type polysaccharide/polyol phosphate transport system ATPase subunit
MSANVLEVSHLTKSFRLHHEKTNSLKGFIVARGRNRFDEFTALDDVSFTVGEGEVFGVIGHNGSGKSTLLKCMAGILVPNSGTVAVNRRMSALLELGAGFHPELSGRENVFLNAAILGMGRKAIASRFDDIVEFSGLENFIDSPVKTYSSGMYVRLAFAVAINVDPELLIIDEILAVGDVTFQQKCMEKFVDFRNQGRTIILVTHAMAAVRDMCDRAVWLDHGKLVAEGDPSELVEAYTEQMLGTRTDRADGSVRRGSGEIQIERVEIFIGDSTTSVKRFRTGDNVTVRLHYRADKPISRPVFGIAIDVLGGSCITSPCARDVGMVPERVVGEGHVDVVMSDIALMPGTFDLHTSVTDFNRQHIYDYTHVAVRFDVMSGKIFETSSVVTLRPSWSLTAGS